MASPTLNVVHALLSLAAMLRTFAALPIAFALSACQLDLATQEAELDGDPIAACPVATTRTLAGHEADFYYCVEDVAQCGDDGYLVGYGARYAERYMQRTRPFLSTAGKRFLDKNLVCLQEALRERVDQFTSCDEIRDLAFDSHPDCYIANGFCELPVRDWLAITATVDGRDLLSRDAQRQMSTIARACARRIIW